VNPLYLVLGLVTAILSGLGAFFYWARRAGGDAEKALTANEVIHAAEIRAQVESDNSKLSDDDLRAKLRVVKR
jgi:hypothetical protein